MYTGEIDLAGSAMFATYPVKDIEHVGLHE